MQKEGKILILAIILISIFFFYSKVDITGQLFFLNRNVDADNIFGADSNPKRVLLEFAIRTKLVAADTCTTTLNSQGLTGPDITIQQTTTGTQYPDSKFDPTAIEEPFSRSDECIDSNTVREIVCSKDIKFTTLTGRVVDHLRRYALSLNIGCPSASTCQNGRCVGDEPDTFDPQLAGYLPSIGSYLSHNFLAYNQPYIYANSREFGLTIIDTSSSPSIIKQRKYAQEYKFNSKEFHNGFLFSLGCESSLSDCFFGSNRLYVLDTSNPQDPQIISSLILPEEINNGLKISGNHAYIVSNINLIVIDISDPTNLQIVNTIPLQGSSGFTEITAINPGNALFIFHNSQTSIHIYDISNPSNPVYKSQFNTLSSRIGEYYNNQYIFYESSQMLKFFDVSNLENPTQISSLPLKCDGVLSSSITIKGRYIYCIERVSSSTSRINIVNADTKQITRKLLDYSDFNLGVKAFNNELFIIGSDLNSYDITDPLNPILKGTIYGNAQYGGVAKKNNILYLSFSKGLMIVDVSDPNNPIIVNYLFENSLSYKRDLLVHNNYLIANDRLYDISNPLNPSFITSLNLGEVTSLFIDGNYLYVAAGFNGLKIYDISNLPSITELGSYNAGGLMSDITVKNNLAYIAYSRKGLYILDVSNKNLPSVISITPPGLAYFRVIIDNNFAYVLGLSSSSDESFILDMFDISNPQNPLITSSIERSDVRGVIDDIEYERDHIYFSSRFQSMVGEEGLYILNLNPSRTDYTPFRHIQGLPEDGLGFSFGEMLRDGNILYVSDTFGILYSLRLYN